MKPIPYGKQFISDKDIEAVVNTLKSDFLTQGPKISEFEAAFANYIGCKYAVALSNGTAALHLCALALDVGPGDKVITTPITFAASANCIKYCGGEVVFSDIDAETYLLDLEKVRRLLQTHPKGTFKGIIPVDFAGKAVDLEGFRQLADEYGLWLIEDACHAPGGYVNDSTGTERRCGDGAFADLAIFSFHPVKHIAAGEGGMITTNNKSLYEKLLMLRTHGITRDQNRFTNSIALAASQEPIPDSGEYPGWYMEMQVLGYNYRITDFQAALGLSQLERADEGVARRRQIAKRYDEALKGHSSIVSGLDELKGVPSGHAYHLYVVKVANRLNVYNYLRKNGIYAQVHYIPVHLMPYYKDLGWKEGDFPVAEEYYSKCLSLPMFPSMTDEEQEYVIEKLLSYFK